MRTDTLIYANATRSVWVVEDCDWGGPCDYTPVCSDGWRGTTVGDVLHIDGTGTIGTRYDAFREGLAYLGLTVKQYMRESEDEVTKHLRQIVLATEQINKIRATVAGMHDLV